METVFLFLLLVFGSAADQQRPVAENQGLKEAYLLRAVADARLAEADAHQAEATVDLCKLKAQEAEDHADNVEAIAARTKAMEDQLAIKVPAVRVAP